MAPAVVVLVPRWSMQLDGTWREMIDTNRAKQAMFRAEAAAMGSDFLFSRVWGTGSSGRRELVGE